MTGWFTSARGGAGTSTATSKPVPLSKLLHVLQTPVTVAHNATSTSSRFSQLLLEHGERVLQDWAVVTYSRPEAKSSYADNNKGSSSSSPSKAGSSIQWEQSNAAKRNSPSTLGGTKKPLSKLSSPHHHHHKKKSNDLDSTPSAKMQKIQGRLYLCSRSLVFEPNETSRGMVRCAFTKMDRPPVLYHPTSDAALGYEGLEVVEWTSQRHSVIKANNVIGPFETVHMPVQFRCTFLHSSPTQMVELCQELFSGNKETLEQVEGGTKAVQPTTSFDVENLVHVREQALTPHPLPCSIMTPLQSQPGVLVLTAERVYFQPASGLSAEPTRARVWSQRDICATARRYHGLRDSALELYFDHDNTSTLLCFERRHDREQALQCVNSPNSNRQVTCFTDREFVVQVVQEWQEGRISNQDYLLALNSAAGRSFHDLSRYPVFPWVIADYSSNKLDLTKAETFRDLTKPIGALNQERLEYFQTRLEGMHDMSDPFLYGTHYSAPGYVLYYLVRSMPEHMLCLQNGKFDAPDRMFHSIAHCYNCVLTNHADVKELIPEFYNTKSYDFLINARGLQLGATQNGDRVDDVTLPPWARSGRDFVKKLSKALESDHVTRQLPAWIDLIFGCSSRGDAARQASNLFHKMCYLGPTDLAGMPTQEERVQAELQSSEFGIVPDQLFCGPHPLRYCHDAVGTKLDEFISPNLGRASSKDFDSSGREAWELLDAPSSTTTAASPPAVAEQPSTSRATRSYEEPTVDVHPTDLHPSASGDPSVDSKDASKNLAMAGSGNPSRSQVESSGTAFSSPQRTMEAAPASPTEAVSSPQTPQFPPTTSAIQWDMKVLERKGIHGDAVSGCVLLLEGEKKLLATTSLDGGLAVNTIAFDASSASDADDQSPFGLSSTINRFSSYSAILSRAQAPSASSQSQLTEYRTHSSRDPLASLVLASDGAGGHVAFAGGHDDVVLAYGINSGCAVASVYSHRDAVTGLDLVTRTPFDKESALWLENATHIMTSGSWDATVKVWSATVASGETVSISREPLAELFDADASIVCVSTKAIPGGGIVIAAGCADGSFCAWNLHADGVQVVIHSEPARRGSGPCSVVQWAGSKGGKLFLFAAFSTGKVASYSLVEGSLQRESAVSVGVAVLSLVYSEEILLVGCADGGLRLIPLRDGAYFDYQPTLWNAVNNKSSPGINSISIAYDKDGNRCVCCTGGTDGSVALFELKRVDSSEQGAAK